MNSKKDIGSREDIEKLMLTFYDKVKRDDLISFIFNDVAKVNWKVHVPIIVDFWETLLLDNHVYQKNAMEVHYHLNKLTALLPEHFERWLYLFTSTVDDMYEGKVAAGAKTKAKSIAAVMQFKMKQSKDKRSIL
jgi:hemoglobin